MMEHFLLLIIVSVRKPSLMPRPHPQEGLGDIRLIPQPLLNIPTVCIVENWKLIYALQVLCHCAEDGVFSEGEIAAIFHGIDEFSIQLT